MALTINISVSAYNTSVTPLSSDQWYTVAYEYTHTLGSTTAGQFSGSGSYLTFNVPSTDMLKVTSFKLTNFACARDTVTDGNVLPLSIVSTPPYFQTFYGDTITPAYVDSSFIGNIGLYDAVNIPTVSSNVDYSVCVYNNSTPKYIQITPESSRRFNDTSGQTFWPAVKVMSTYNGSLSFISLSSYTQYATVYPAQGAYWYVYDNLKKYVGEGVKYILTTGGGGTIVKYSYECTGTSFVSVDSTNIYNNSGHPASLDIYPYFNTLFTAPYVDTKQDLFGYLCYCAIYSYYSIYTPDEADLDLSKHVFNPAVIDKWDGASQTAITEPDNNKYATYDAKSAWYFGYASTANNAYSKYLNTVTLQLNNGVKSNDYVINTSTNSSLTFYTKQKSTSYTASLTITTRLPHITVYNYNLSDPYGTTVPMSFTIGGNAVYEQSFNFPSPTPTSTSAIDYVNPGGGLTISNLTLANWENQNKKIAITYQYASSSSAGYKTLVSDVNGTVKLFPEQASTTQKSEDYGTWHDIIAYTTFVDNDKFEVKISSSNSVIPLTITYDSVGENTVTLGAFKDNISIYPYKSALRFISISPQSPYSNIYAVNTVSVIKNGSVITEAPATTVYPILSTAQQATANGQYRVSANISAKNVGNIWKANSSPLPYQLNIGGNYSSYATGEERVVSDVAINADLTCSISQFPKPSGSSSSYIVDSCTLYFYSASSASTYTDKKVWTSEIPGTINLYTYFFKDNTGNMAAAGSDSKYVLDVDFTLSSTSVSAGVFYAPSAYKPGFSLTIGGTKYSITENTDYTHLLTFDSLSSITPTSWTFDCPRIIPSGSQFKYTYALSDGSTIDPEVYSDVTAISSRPIEIPAGVAANQWKGVSIVPTVVVKPNTSVTLNDNSGNIKNYTVSVTDDGKTETIQCTDASSTVIATKVPASTSITVNSFAVTGESDWEVTKISDGTTTKTIPCTFSVGGTEAASKLYITADRIKAPITVKTTGEFIKYNIYYTDYSLTDRVYTVSSESATLDSKYSAKSGSNAIKITAITPSDNLYQIDGTPTITINGTTTDINLSNPTTINITTDAVINVKLKKDVSQKIFGVNMNSTAWEIDDDITLNYSVVLDNPYLQFDSFSYTGFSQYGRGVSIDSAIYSGTNNISLPITYTGSNYSEWIDNAEDKKLKGHITITSNSAGTGNETLYCVDREKYTPFTLAYNDTGNNWNLNLSKAFVKNTQKSISYSVFMDCSVEWKCTVIPYDTAAQTTADPVAYGKSFTTSSAPGQMQKLTFADCGIAAENYGVVLKNPCIYSKYGTPVPCKYKLGVMGTIIPVEMTSPVARIWSSSQSGDFKLSIVQTTGGTEKTITGGILLTYYGGESKKLAVDVQLPSRGEYTFNVQYWNNTGSLPEFSLVQATPSTGTSWKSTSCVLEKTISCTSDLNEFYVS